MSQPIYWYQHVSGGAVHGFTHPLPTEIEAQVAAGKLRPCDAPVEGDVNMGQLDQAQITALMAADLKESHRVKRARLLAELAELGDEEDEDQVEVPEDVSPPEGLSGGDALSQPAPKPGPKPRGRSQT